METVSSFDHPQHGRARGSRRAAIVVASIGLMLWICETSGWLARQLRPAK